MLLGRTVCFMAIVRVCLVVLHKLAAMYLDTTAVAGLKDTPGLVEMTVRH